MTTIDKHYSNKLLPRGSYLVTSLLRIFESVKKNYFDFDSYLIFLLSDKL